MFVSGFRKRKRIGIEIFKETLNEVGYGDRIDEYTAAMPGYILRCADKTRILRAIADYDVNKELKEGF